MRAVIPVAGIGTRLRPHTHTVPKVLLNVAGKPILGHILEKIIREGVTEATIVVGHMSEMIHDYVSTAFPGFRVDYVEQEEQLGLGHAIYVARATMGREPVLIILGDTIFDVDLTPVMRGKVSAIGVKTVEDPRRFGVAETQDGRIVRLIEKPERPASNLALVGLYWIVNTTLLLSTLESMVRDDVRTKGEYQLTDALQIMIERGEPMTTFPVEGWYDCGNPETLLSTNRVLLERGSTYRPIEGVVIVEPVYIAPTATIGNAIIGPNTTVADHAVVTDAIIRNSIIGEHALVSSALLDTSIVGNGSVLQGRYKRFNVGDSSQIELS